MDSDLVWVNGKSGRQSWRYPDAFPRSIISEAIYHLFTISFACDSTRPQRRNSWNKNLSKWTGERDAWRWRVIPMQWHRTAKHFRRPLIVEGHVVYPQEPSLTQRAAFFGCQCPLHKDIKISSRRVWTQWMKGGPCTWWDAYVHWGAASWTLRQWANTHTAYRNSSQPTCCPSSMPQCAPHLHHRQQVTTTSQCPHPVLPSNNTPPSAQLCWNLCGHPLVSSGKRW